jgi:uncharacterized protein (TIGR02996 family)
MESEDGFLNVIADDPCDLVTHVVYADWLEERGDERAACLRAWLDMLSIPYEDASYRVLEAAVREYQALIGAADPAWVRRLASARDWVDVLLAQTLARLHLRVRHGRKADRQWVEPPAQRKEVWYVHYWRNPPERRKGNPWREQGHLRVDRVTGEVLPLPLRLGERT